MHGASTPLEPRRPASDTPAYLDRLHATTSQHHAGAVTESLDAIRTFLADDLAVIEATLAGVVRGGSEVDTPLHNSALHLLSLSGKRLRPLCVALAARIGGSFNESARAVAVSVELVHNATLLHDDVVDVSDARRGSPTARVVYGNAASVYAGDWLLIDALQRLETCGRADLMVRLLRVLREMLDGEALQLEKRGNVDATVDDYFRIVRGKTASLFRFALYAGGAAGNVPERDCQALGAFGEAMGVAFQVTDDTLDLAGAAQDLGKNIFADLHEGKFTYPLLLAMERAPHLRETLRHGLAGNASAGLDAEVLNTLEVTGALADARAKALELSTEAMAALGAVPDCTARKALEQVAVALVHRKY